MEYAEIVKGRFLKRPNRFLAEIALDGCVVTCHVKNTGRCRELLVPDATVYLERAGNPARKTEYDLVAVEKGRRLINMDAQAPNRVFQEWMDAGCGETMGLPAPTLLRAEKVWGNSRFDFYWEAGVRRGFVEVKGVTLEEEGAVYFPDAPTERGVKHVEELISAHQAGYEACVFFVVQMSGVTHFSPNDRTHPAFGDVLRRASREGVQVLACDCEVHPGSLKLRQPVKVVL